MLFLLACLVSLILFFLLIVVFRFSKLLMLLIVIVFPLLVKLYVVQTFKIPAGSMLPTLKIGDRILTNKYIYKFQGPERGDLVIFRFPKDPSIYYVKRIVAIGGDQVQIVNKKLLVNGESPQESYAHYATARVMPASGSPRDNFGPITVPADSVFTLGDNRDNSYDSRFWGFVKQDAVLARVEMVYWSKDPEKGEIRWDRIGVILR